MVLLYWQAKQILPKLPPSLFAMRIKTFLIMVLSLASLTAFAQGGGVKGKVVSRTTRAAIDGVKVTLTPGDITTTTDATGNFEIDKLAKGEYSLTFEATEFES